MTKPIELLDQIIEIQKQIDLSDKDKALKENKGSQSLGESKMLFHLKVLKELLIEEDKKLEDILVPNKRNEFSSNSIANLGYKCYDNYRFGA